jgi:hypothetical protein
MTARVVGVSAGLVIALSHAMSAAAAPSSLVVRADRESPRLGTYRVRDDPTMRGMIRVFGRPSSCRLTSGISSVATWDRFGLRTSFATFGGIPPGQTACTYRRIWVSSIRLTGKRWQTGLRLRVGDSVGELRRLYPRARYQRRRIGEWPARSYWLVHYRERCVIGVCPRPYHQVPKLIAGIREGVVTSFILPVGAQGD